jgi:methylated-DNA-protein-cysteine methyltransferase related protein
VTQKPNPAVPKRRKAPAPHPLPDQLTAQRTKRHLLRDATRPDEPRDLAFQRMILAIPAGKVSTYGAVAAAAGYPQYHRAVARLLRTFPVDHLPWHRVVGSGGEIKLHDDAAREQRSRLKLEGVEFSGKRINMDRFEHTFRTWEIYE